MHDGRFYITGDDRNISVLNAGDGSVLWQKTIYANGASPVEAHGIVYVGGSGTGYIYALAMLKGGSTKIEDKS